MEPYIAPKMLLINGKQSPCLCTDRVICSYCVQANLFLWEEKQRSTTKNVQDPLIASIKEKGIRSASRKIGVSKSTINYWIKSRNIPNRYIDKIRQLSE